MKRILFIILIAMSASCSNHPQAGKVKITQIPGKIQFTDVYKQDVAMCIPAAYTDKEGKIEGQYRIKGVTYGRRSLREFTSIHPTKGLLIGREWMSDNGFQQHVLVKNGKVRIFKDKRRFRRRALCCSASDPGSLFIIESKRKMTMNEFAAEVARYSTNAVNLDMGRWGYGWIGKKKLSPWTVVYKRWQTNWIVCE